MIILGVDQSYTRTGFSICEDGEIKVCTSADLSGFKSNKAKRKMIRNFTGILVDKYDPDEVIVERVRLYSRGSISLKSIIPLGAIISCIDDAVSLPIYSVDSRSWKARVVGSASCSKQDAIDFIYDLTGLEVNEDAADSGCISLYPFQDGARELLKKVN